jgi:group I intron endonuclease
MTGIYQINLGNGYFYIGSAVRLGNRERQHRQELKRGSHSNQKMQNCWNKYQIFEFLILEKCETQQLLIAEQKWIDRNFSNPKNVNLSPTAGSSFGVIHSTETRAKMSAANKGKVMSAETRAKISAGNKGKVQTDITRAKIGAANKGKVRSAEFCAKMSAANKGKVHSAETRAKMSAARKGKVLSAETRAKISAAKKGHIHSDETRANMSAAQLRYHQNAKIA